MEQYATLECKVETYSETSNPNLMNVKLRVMHDGENKKSKISLDAIKEAEDTLRNTPILARVLDDGSDFNEHDTKLERVDGKYKLKYLEKPIGVIGHDSEIRYETINGRTYLTATGYIWSRYCQEAVEIIKNAQKGVSMEIQILEGKLNEDDVYEVTKFVFTGVTVLGDHVESAMYDTYLETYSVMKDYKKELEKIYKEIYSLKNNDKEVSDSMTKKVENIKDSREDVKVDPNQTKNKVDEKAKTNQEDKTHSLSVDDLYRMINKVLETEKKEIKDWDGEQYPVSKYWIETILPMDKIVVLSEHGNWGEYFGVPFEVSGDSIQLDMNKMVGYVREWREKKVGEEVITFLSADEEKKHAMEKYSKVKEDLKKLKEYKDVKDKEELEKKVEDIIANFKGLDEDEVEELKSKVLEGKLGLDEFKKELFCLVGMKSLKSKEKYSIDKKNNKVGFIGLEGYSLSIEEEKPYGGLFEKYGMTE